MCVLKPLQKHPKKPLPTGFFYGCRIHSWLRQGIAMSGVDIGLCCNFLGHLENLAPSIGGHSASLPKNHPELWVGWSQKSTFQDWETPKNPWLLQGIETSNTMEILPPLVGNQKHVLINDPPGKKQK